MTNDTNGRKLLPHSPNKSGIVLFILILIALAAVFCLFAMQSASAAEISYSLFLRYVEQDLIRSVKITDGQEISGVIRFDGGESASFRTVIPYDDGELIDLLKRHDVQLSGEKSAVPFWYYIIEFLPLLVMIMFFAVLIRQSRGNGRQAFQFGKSRARLYEGNKKIAFADVAGQEEAKNELQEIVEFLKNPRKFTKMGARIPKGVLLVGMPGTGKTMLARAVAGEANVAYFHMSGSDFVEMFVGVGASRVRDLFEQGRKNAPCIIFIDELDAVGRTRGAGYGGGHDEREQTLNQMLVEMDGFDTKDGVIILAATNRPDVLDPALLRPGRFDRQVVVAMPDVKEREAVLKLHASKIPLSPEVDLRYFARATPGMSGADLANIVNEAALFAARKNKDAVEKDDFEEARDKILMGVARRSIVMPEDERRMTAVHEAGHALLHYFLEHADPLHKVTIVPRGRALGVAISLPEHDSYSRRKSWILDRITICYGGYAAETLVYGETSTGTAEDLSQAAELARKMVCQWGMSDAVGAVSFGQEETPIFIGKEIAQHKDYSEETARLIDAAVADIALQCKEKALSVLAGRRNMLEALTQALINQETLSDDEIRALPEFASAPDLRAKALTNNFE